jgi:hypothetical protein
MTISRNGRVSYGLGLVPIQFYVTHKHDSKELIKYCLREGWMIKDFATIDDGYWNLDEILQIVERKLQELSSFARKKDIFIHLNRRPVVVNVIDKGLMVVIEILRITSHNHTFCVSMRD